MSPSNGRRLLSDADSSTFAPPLPPEAFGWRRPGPVILNSGGFSKPLELPGPISEQSAAPAGTAKNVSSPDKATKESSTPVKTSNDTSATVKASNEASTPIKGSHEASAPVNGFHKVSTPAGASNGVSTSSPEPAGSARWNQIAELPSQALPRESPAHIIGMSNDPRSSYRYKRTRGQPIAYPSEDAGPIADRRCADAPSVTISNTYGNLRIHVSTATVQIWYLGKTSDNKTAWIEAEEGDAHPDIPGIALSTATKFRPQWIRGASFEAQQTPSRAARRLEKLKANPY